MELYPRAQTLDHAAAEKTAAAGYQNPPFSPEFHG
jgi:hypothetical protein